MWRSGVVPLPREALRNESVGRIGELMVQDSDYIDYSRSSRAGASISAGRPSRLPCWRRARYAADTVVKALRESGSHHPEPEATSRTGMG